MVLEFGQEYNILFPKKYKTNVLNHEKIGLIFEKKNQTVNGFYLFKI